jgi:hypothetical protein
MKEKMVVFIITQLYAGIIRPALVKAVNETDNEVDNKLVEILDMLLGIK